MSDDDLNTGLTPHDHAQLSVMAEVIQSYHGAMVEIALSKPAAATTPEPESKPRRRRGESGFRAALGRLFGGRRRTESRVLLSGYDAMMDPRAPPQLWEGGGDVGVGAGAEGFVKREHGGDGVGVEGLVELQGVWEGDTGIGMRVMAERDLGSMLPGYDAMGNGRRVVDCEIEEYGRFEARVGSCMPWDQYQYPFGLPRSAVT
ncbi:hypothetical protein F4779DRAFT_425098 [Xylariaceae sp. FL0662B]|nr:hypothetical protein F4779DRAFT_425098 [Xylariaceae sp. FL0662B]